MTKPKKIMHEHRTRKIELNGEPVHIDTKLASLILELNRAGLKTTACCQGGTVRRPKLGDDLSGTDGWAYISFIIDDDCYFEYSVCTGALDLRWKRTKRRLTPYRSRIDL